MTQPINKYSLTQRNTDKDSNHKTLALTPRVNMPLGQLGPMPLVNVPSPEVMKAGRDLAPTPEIDLSLEVPIQEAQIEALFRSPEPGDFTLPPALSEHAKGKHMVAQSLPKQSEIDKLLKTIE